MAKPLLSDELWERVEPLLPAPKPRRYRYPGRKPLTNRQALTGILFVLRTGINWNDLPCEMGCGSGSACRKYLQSWQRQGVWDRRHRLLLAELQEADKIDWSRASVDSSFCRALGGGEDTGRNPTDRGKLGSKHHAVVDGQGVPRSATVTAANVPDVVALLGVVDAIEPVPGQVGRPPPRPAGGAVRRPGLRQRPASGGIAQAVDPAFPRAAAHRAWQRLGRLPLGGRALLRLAAPLPQAPHPHRLLFRQSPRVTQTCLLADLFELPVGNTVTIAHSAIVSYDRASRRACPGGMNPPAR